MAWIEKLLDKFFWLWETICKVLMCVQIVCVTFVVVGRYVFNKTPAWGEETTLLCLVWVSLISAAITLRERKHMRITILDKYLSRKALFVLDLLCYAGLMCFAVMLIRQGVALTKLTSMSILPGLRIRSSYLYSATLFSGIVFVIAILEKVWLLITGKEQPECQ